MPDWRERLVNAMIEMTSHSRKKGKAVLKVYFYKQNSGVVRIIFEKNPLETEEFFDKGIDED